MTEPDKTCKKCGETKPLSLFVRDANQPSGRRDPCKACWAAKGKRNHKGHSRIIKPAIVFQAWRDLHRNRCGICGGTDRLVADHCHKTGRLRSLLCNACNLGLGCFRDRPELLDRAKKYLIAWERAPDILDGVE